MLNLSWDASQWCNIWKTKLRKKIPTGLSHFGLAIYINKLFFKAKEELWKLKYISPCKKYNLQNILQKKPLISSFNNTSQKKSSFKNPHIKNRPIIIIIFLVGAKIPYATSYYTL
jgi:hypothetical protein